MVSELESMGTRLMVSVWPCLNPLSASYEPISERGALVSSSPSPNFHTTRPERGMSSRIGTSFCDQADPKARQYIWEHVPKSHCEARARVFRLGASEPGHLLHHLHLICQRW